MSDTPIYDAVMEDQYFNPTWTTPKVLVARPWATRAGIRIKARKARREAASK